MVLNNGVKEMSWYYFKEDGSQSPIADHLYFPRSSIVLAAINNNKVTITYTKWSCITIETNSPWQMELIMEILNGDSVMVHIDRSRFEDATRSQ